MYPDLNTCDLHLSAYLMAKGCTLKNSIRDQQTQRVYFTVGSEEFDPHNLRVEYFSGQGQVSALKFSNNLKSLKSLCHSIL